MRTMLKAVLVCAVSLVLFVWGFLTNRNEIFPFHLLRVIALELGTVDDAYNMVRSPSPALAALQSLPYVSGTFDPDRAAAGVVLHRPEMAAAGYNLYTSKSRGQAHLLDMDGKFVHQWTYPTGAQEIHSELLPNGDMVVVLHKAIDKSYAVNPWSSRLVKIDKTSEVLWTYDAPVHHDVDIDVGDLDEDGEGGDIYALTRHPRRIPEIHPEGEVFVDTIVRLSSAGVEQEAVTVLELFDGSPYTYLLPSVAHMDASGWTGPLDITHLNHVEVMGGKILISLRNINTVAIVDWAAREIVWLWGPGNLTYQHHPTWLDTGHILIFDNGTERSRVIEVDPLNFEVTWSYGPREDFFSRTRGSSQRLTNGNTLITHSDRGWAFEVTPQSETVWKFANPVISPDGEREALWRISRFAPESLTFLP